MLVLQRPYTPSAHLSFFGKCEMLSVSQEYASTSPCGTLLPLRLSGGELFFEENAVHHWSAGCPKGAG